mmetsp:Transcript_40393/g.108190  ORF Transcript_40393/g.108190 Transcript_40393/m.108190 type:complete len:93 (-) Transcript_40393:74-352(-)
MEGVCISGTTATKPAPLTNAGALTGTITSQKLPYQTAGPFNLTAGVESSGTCSRFFPSLQFAPALSVITYVDMLSSHHRALQIGAQAGFTTQ